MASKAEIVDAYFRSKNYYSHVPYKPIGEVLVEEVERMGTDGLYLSTAAALVEKESGGKNVFGCDWGPRWTDAPPYCQVAVTKERVRLLIENVEDGGGQNGVGLTQLTTISLVYEAQKLGGAHLPRYQMRVGFKYLNDLIAQLGWPAGAAAYNAGAGNWRSVITTYGADMQRLEREWAARLAKGTDSREPGGGGVATKTPMERAEAAIELGMKMLGILYGNGWEEGTWPAGAPLYSRCDKNIHTLAYAKAHNCICTGFINFLREHIADLGAIGRAQGDPYPGGTAAIHRTWGRMKGVRPYPPVANTPRGWLCYSPYLGPALRLQGHVGIALGNGRVLEARVPSLSNNRTEDQGHRALISGGGQGYTHIIPPSVWMAV